MRASPRTYRLLALLLSAVLLGPVLPWAALRVPDGHGAICHHIACPHKGQHCTCHGHDGTPLWQRCHDGMTTLDGTPAMPYGPLPARAGLIPQVRTIPVLLAEAAPPPFRSIADIFHPPR